MWSNFSQKTISNSPQQELAYNLRMEDICLGMKHTHTAKTAHMKASAIGDYRPLMNYAPCMSIALNWGIHQAIFGVVIDMIL